MILEIDLLLYWDPSLSKGKEEEEEKEGRYEISVYVPISVKKPDEAREMGEKTPSDRWENPIEVIRVHGSRSLFAPSRDAASLRKNHDARPEKKSTKSVGNFFLASSPEGACVFACTLYIRVGMAYFAESASIRVVHLPCREREEAISHGRKIARSPGSSPDHETRG